MDRAFIPLPEVTTQPVYCQYAAGPCDQSFASLAAADAVFLYPSDPPIIASTIEETKRKVARSGLDVRSWRELPIVGQIIFCQICKATRFARAIVVDVTTLNFNLLFEIGYALGLGLPVIPIRDASFERDRRDFDELGLLDTLGYLDFQNSDELALGLEQRVRQAAFSFEPRPPNRSQPLFVVKSPAATDGQIKMMSVFKKSGIRFRTFDPRETSRISLQDAYREIKTSMGVAAHLLSPDRVGARVHNGRCALLCGMAMANNSRVLMLQESEVLEPIDFRDVVRSYEKPAQVEPILIPFIRSLVEELQGSRFVPTTLSLTRLEKIDLGDVAAENEISALRTYFLPTAQYNDVRRGRARLVVGRKGTGKTAIFYGVRNAFWNSRSHVVLDLKPEGHQFTKLRETVLTLLPPGTQEHVLTAFWNYILLTELAHKILGSEYEYGIAHRDKRLGPLFDHLSALIGTNRPVEEGDFSERLLRLVEEIASRVNTAGDLISSGAVTELIYDKDVKTLTDVLSEYLKSKEGVWLLFDNLDKGWPVDDVRPEDILLIRALLEATRKLQRQFARHDLECNAVVFIRNDIFTHLIEAIPDKGKDSWTFLDWTDQGTLAEMIRRRIVASADTEEDFETLWTTFFDSHVGGEESFSYILRRTLMRPRDLIRYLRQSINVAVNRGHERVQEADISEAEDVFSEDQLQEVSFELRDVSADFADVVYAFIGCPINLSEEGLKERLREGGVPADDVDRAIRLLLWFCFVGVLSGAAGSEEKYSYEYQYGVDRLLRDAGDPRRFVIHPAFRRALGVVDA